MIQYKEFYLEIEDAIKTNKINNLKLRVDKGQLIIKNTLYNRNIIFHIIFLWLLVEFYSLQGVQAISIIFIVVFLIFLLMDLVAINKIIFDIEMGLIKKTNLIGIKNIIHFDEVEKYTISESYLQYAYKGIG